MLARAVLAGLLLSCASLAAADSPGSNTTEGDAAPMGRAADLEEEAVGPSTPPSAPEGDDGGDGDGGDESAGEGGSSGGGDSEGEAPEATEDEDDGNDITGGGGGKGGKWPRCGFETGNDTHSLLGIMSGRFTDRFGEATFSNLLLKVDAPTLRALKDFNVSRRGYTLIVPRNRATNFTDPNLSTRPLFSLYGLDPVFVSPRKATRIVRNHIIPQTLTYFDLEKLTEAGTPVRYESLGEAVWEFEFFTTEGAVDGTVVLTDTYNVTQERTDDGVLYMQWDISNGKPGECPNAVFTVDGLLATPDTVNPPDLDMGPAPAPYVAPAPLAPRQIVRASAGRAAAIDTGPAPAPAAAPAGLVDDDRREALAANMPSGCPAQLTWGPAIAVLPLAVLALLGWQL